jgi:hypothetical protein
MIECSPTHHRIIRNGWFDTPPPPTLHLLLSSLSVLYTLWTRYPAYKHLNLIYGQGGLYINDIIVQITSEPISLQIQTHPSTAPLHDNGTTILAYTSAILCNRAIPTLSWHSLRATRLKHLAQLRRNPSLAPSRLPFDINIRPVSQFSLIGLNPSHEQRTRSSQTTRRSSVTYKSVSPLPPCR